MVCLESESSISVPTVTPASAFVGIIHALASAVAPDLPVGSPGYLALQTLLTSLQPAPAMEQLSSRSNEQVPFPKPSNPEMPAIESLTSPIPKSHATPALPAPSPALHLTVAPPTPSTPKFCVGTAPAPTPTDAFKQYCKGRLTRQYDPDMVAHKTTHNNTNKQTPTGPKSTTRAPIAPVFVTPVRATQRVGTTPTPIANKQHAGEKLTQYSIQTRLDIIDDFYHGVPMDQLLTKYSIASQKSISRWLKEYGEGHYDDCYLWTVEKRAKTFKIGNLGRKVSNPELEKHLISFMAALDDAHLQFLSSMLILEALEEYPCWLGVWMRPGSWTGRISLWCVFVTETAWCGECPPLWAKKDRPDLRINGTCALSFIT